MSRKPYRYITPEEKAQKALLNKQDRHTPDNGCITLRVWKSWLASVDNAAKARGLSRRAFIIQSVDKAMAEIPQDPQE